MRFIDYIKDKAIYILFYLLNLILSIIIFVIFETKLELIIIISFLYLLVGICILILNFLKKKEFYNNLISNLYSLDKKYLVTETLPKPETYEEKILCECLYETNKSMVENIKLYENNVIEFKEFVEMWIHEVKLPISSLVLKCHNNKEKYDKSFLEQIRRLNNYIDQVLYYVRSENTEKDFSIKETNLSDIIRNVSLRNKDDLLDNKIDLEVDDINYMVYTDSKWMEFIVNQIINNSIKYKKDADSVIKISAEKKDNKVILSIYDNGIGISKKDLPRVFEKTFTGENGRKKYKSTGMGLYISKQLCDKLGHLIEIDSLENEFTSLIITFENNDLYKVL